MRDSPAQERGSQPGQDLFLRSLLPCTRAYEREDIVWDIRPYISYVILAFSATGRPLEAVGAAEGDPSPRVRQGTPQPWRRQGPLTDTPSASSSFKMEGADADTESELVVEGRSVALVFSAPL